MSVRHNDESASDGFVEDTRYELCCHGQQLRMVSMVSVIRDDKHSKPTGTSTRTADINMYQQGTRYQAPGIEDIGHLQAICKDCTGAPSAHHRSSTGASWASSAENTFDPAHFDDSHGGL